MNLPPLSPALISWLESAAQHKGATALNRALHLPGNPLDVTLLESHGLRGCIVASLPDLPWYNVVSGLSEDNMQFLPAMLNEYVNRDIAPSISLWAAHLTPVIEAALFNRGFRVQRHSSTLYIVAERLEPQTAAGVTVCELSLG